MVMLRNRRAKRRKDEGTYHECHHGHLRDEDANDKKVRIWELSYRLRGLRCAY